MQRVACCGERQYDYRQNVLLPTSRLNEKFVHYTFFFQNNPRGLSFSFEAAVYSVIAVAFDPTTEYVCRMKGCNKVGERNPSQLNCITTLLSVLQLSILLWEALTYDNSHVIFGQSKLN